VSKPLHEALAERDPSVTPVMVREERGSFPKNAARALRLAALLFLIAGWALVLLDYPFGWGLIAVAGITEGFEWVFGRLGRRDGSTRSEQG